MAALAKQAPGLAVASAEGDADHLRAHLTSHAGNIRAEIALEPTSRKIENLLFRPELARGPALASLPEADARAEAIAPKAQLYVAELDRGGCEPRHALGARQELAIGSTFKLHVLLAVADRIAAGRLRWDDPIAIRDDWRSLPSGTTQDDPAGTRLTVRSAGPTSTASSRHADRRWMAPRRGRPRATSITSSGSRVWCSPTRG